MWPKKRKSPGFTIVELLIVIVVIGVLAAIVIVAYNGVTQSAKTAKTLSAVDSWAKAIQMYRAATGNFPTQQSCLGSSTTYPDTGIGPYCWDITYWDVKANFLSQLAPYIGSHPEPDVTNIGTADYNRRGAFYHIVSTTDHRIRAVFAGESSCPASSAGPLLSSTVQTGGIYCQYGLD